MSARSPSSASSTCRPTLWRHRGAQTEDACNCKPQSILVPPKPGPKRKSQQRRHHASRQMGDNVRGRRQDASAVDQCVRAPRDKAFTMQSHAKRRRLHSDERVEANVRARMRVQMGPECHELIYAVHGRQTAHQCRLWRTSNVATDRRLARRAKVRRHKIRANVHQSHAGHAKHPVRHVSNDKCAKAEHDSMQPVFLPNHSRVPINSPKRHVKQKTRATQEQMCAHKPPRRRQATVHRPAPQVIVHKRAQAHHAE